MNASSHAWEATIQDVPPSAATLKTFYEVNLRGVRLRWYTHLRQAFGDTPKATGRRRLEIVFIQEHVEDVADLVSRARACIVGPMLEIEEVRSHYSKGRKAGQGFFGARPGLGLILGDGREWLDLSVKGIFGADECLTSIHLSDLRIGDSSLDRHEELCAYTQQLQQSLRSLSARFTGPDGDISRMYAQEAAKTLLQHPEPRALQVWKRGQVITDTPAEEVS